MPDEIPSQHWAVAPPEVQKIRMQHAESVQDLHLDLVRKQVESIAKYLLLVNAGGAAAVLAAMAQKVEYDFKWTLSAFVLGVILTGFAMSCSLRIYSAGSRINALGFEQHVFGSIDWHQYIAMCLPKNWQGLDRIVFNLTTPVYWLSFLAFIAGCGLGARAVWTL